jgi:4-amino-4-deoxy-L-arabinose transferase-like glycosyltransferase
MNRPITSTHQSRSPFKTSALNSWVQILILWIVCFFSFFIHLGAHEVDLMEARNFVTAREMVIEGHWLIPTMNGEIRIAKPPLPTWITAIVGIVEGNVDNKVVMRLPAAMMATLMVFAFWGLMRTLSVDPFLPVVSALILSTSLMVIDMGRRGTWDIYCHSFMVTGLWTLSYGLKKENHAYGSFVITGIFFSLSFMSKGPVAFYSLLFPFCVAYFSTFKIEKLNHKKKGLILVFGLFFLLIGMWPLFIYIQHPELSINVAIEEMSAWGNRHSQPIYFYAHFVIYSGIWAPAVVAGLIKPYAKKKIDQFVKYRFVITWIILTLILLSVIPEKKERYLLPAMIPMALLAGSLWRNLFQAFTKNSASIGDRRLLTTLTVVNSIISFAMPILLFRYGVATERIMTLPFAISWSVVFVLLAAAIIILYNKGMATTIFMSTLVLMSLINVSILPVFFQSSLCKKKTDVHPLRAIRQMEELRGLKIYSAEKLDIRLIWDAGRTIGQWDYKNQPLPLENMPMAFISTADPTQGLRAKYRDKMNVTVIEKFSIQSVRQSVTYFLTLISPKETG